ncbi:MAG TPA: hypothetical protein VL201_05770 [Patescibacteria group bacterium]|nr:hypothetical protein [Patescibacteria group bacterium]
MKHKKIFLSIFLMTNVMQAGPDKIVKIDTSKELFEYGQREDARKNFRSFFVASCITVPLIRLTFGLACMFFEKES